MSRAFVKENEDQIPELPERPQSPHPNFVTPHGLALLKQQLATLEESRHRHAGDGDLLDKDAVLVIERDLRYVQERLSRAVVVDPAQQDHGKVEFGATVETVDETMPNDASKSSAKMRPISNIGKLSWVSPLAIALRDARKGDTVVWKRPAGDLELEIASIEYPSE